VNDDPTNPGPNVRLDRGGWISGPCLDSESWQCAGCGGQFIGNRTPDDLCGPCIAHRLAGPAGEIPRLDVPMTLALLAELHPGWTIVRDEAVGAWTGERRRGSELHFVAALEGWELSLKIRAAEQAGQ
jgi:hypothetical protein